MENARNYSLDIELTALKGAGVGYVADAAGNSVKCVIIPVAENNLFVGVNGRVHMSVAMFERTNRETGRPEADKYGNSHSLRLSVPKEERKKMTEEQKKAIPYVGNGKVMETSQKPVKEYSNVSFTPSGVAMPAPTQVPAGTTKGDDLPF